MNKRNRENRAETVIDGLVFDNMNSWLIRFGYSLCLNPNHDDRTEPNAFSQIIIDYIGSVKSLYICGTADHLAISVITCSNRPMFEFVVSSILILNFVVYLMGVCPTSLQPWNFTKFFFYKIKSQQLKFSMGYTLFGPRPQLILLWPKKNRNLQANKPNLL